MDLGVLVQHAWTYRALCHDVLDMKLNRVTINEDVDGKRLAKTYDLDSTDSFWTSHTGEAFQTVAEDVDASLNDYRAQMEQINKSGLEDMQGDDALAESTKQLASTLNQLPELQEKKKQLDMHTNIGQHAGYCTTLKAERRKDGFDWLRAGMETL